MSKIGLFYGTQTGYTQTAAEMIQQEFGGEDKLAIALRYQFHQQPQAL